MSEQTLQHLQLKKLETKVKILKDPSLHQTHSFLLEILSILLPNLV